MFFPRVRPVRVAGEHDQRRAGVERLDQPRHEIRRAGPERRVGEAHAPRHLGVGIGREHAGALVVNEVVRQPEPAGRVVEGQELEAAHPKHRAAPKGPDHAGERFAPGHLIRRHGRTFSSRGRGGATGEIGDGGDEGQHDDHGDDEAARSSAASPPWARRRPGRKPEIDRHRRRELTIATIR
jgi:hypothetical protein